MGIFQAVVVISQGKTYGAAGSGRLFLIGSAMVTDVLFYRWDSAFLNGGGGSAFETKKQIGGYEVEEGLQKNRKGWMVRGFPCANEMLRGGEKLHGALEENLRGSGFVQTLATRRTGRYHREFFGV